MVSILMKKYYLTNMPSGRYIRKNKKTQDELKESRKKYWNNYYIKNKQKLLLRNKERRINNPEYYKNYEKERYSKNPEFYKKRWKDYLKKGREVVNTNRRNKYSNDLNYKISCIMRNRFYKSVKRKKITNSSISFLGCSIDEFKEHIEKKFLIGMNWDNWKYNGWHIDHIIPLSRFNLKDKNEIKKAFHYSNLQPMWGIENIKKYNKITI